MFVLTGLLVASVLGGAPPAAKLEVVHDDTTATKMQWAPKCGELPRQPTLPRGTEVDLVTVGEDWQLRIGGHPLFGTDLCAGSNPSLRAVAQRREGDEWFIGCKEARTVKGTETSETTLRRHADGRVEVRSAAERYVRKLWDQCRLLVERRVLLAPVAEPSDAPTAPASVATLAKPAAPGPPPRPPLAPDGPAGVALSAGARAQIESELNREIKRALERTEVGRLRVMHENRMTAEFAIVERHYLLDGNPLGEEEGAAWGKLPTGQLSEAIDDVVPTGVHVLEVEFVYVGPGGIKLRVKDALFFDVKTEEPTVVRIVSYEAGNWFTATKDRPKLQFTINGRPPPK